MSNRLIKPVIYPEWVKEELPDKIIKYTMKHSDGKLTHRFATYKKNKDSEIVGYTTGKVYFPTPCEENIYLLFHEGDDTWSAEVTQKKKLFRRNIGYVQVGENKFIALTKSWIPFILLLFIGMLLTLLLLFNNDDIKIHLGDKIDIEDNDNVINLGDIPEDEKVQDITADQAFISGQSLTVVKENYQNVYLINDEVNDKYVLVYEIYVEGHDNYVYKTGSIPAGQAEPWNAFNCEQIKGGENNIRYEVYIYDLNGNQVAQTSLTGLKVIKK